MNNAYREFYNRLDKERDEFVRWLREQPFDVIVEHAPELDVMGDILHAVECIIEVNENDNRILQLLIEEELSLSDLTEVAMRRLSRDTMPAVICAVCDAAWTAYVLT